MANYAMQTDINQRKKTMNKVNYHKKMLELIDDMEKRQERRSLLLHCCCAPCACYVIDWLSKYFDITALYYNPNITDIDEYNLRFTELKRLCADYGIDVTDGGYAPSAFFSRVKGYERDREGGARCEICIGDRLDFTARMAEEQSFDYFATTLTVSPLKNSEKINACGAKHAKYLPSDFKKNDGYKKGVAIADRYGLYRQNYCGCEYSKRARTEELNRRG